MEKAGSLALVGHSNLALAIDLGLAFFSEKAWKLGSVVCTSFIPAI
jgi:hypothetical protein